MKITLTKSGGPGTVHLRYDGRRFSAAGGEFQLVADSSNVAHDPAGRHEPMREAAARGLLAWTEGGWSAEITVEDSDEDEFGEDVIP